MIFKRIIGLVAFLLVAIPAYACDHYARPYNTAGTVDFCLWKTDGTAFKTDASYASGDIKIAKDEGVEANSTNGFTDEGSCYSWAFTATEAQTARMYVTIIDQTSPVWLDKCLIIETYGNASAQFPTADVNVISVAADAIGPGDIADNTITAAKIATDAIGSSEIASDAIGSSEIAATGAQEVADSTLATTVSELSAMPSSATPTVAQMLRWYYQYGTGKYKTLTTGTEKTLIKDDGTTPLGTCTTNDDGTTYTRGECS